jgi:hypothetical protein
VHDYLAAERRLGRLGSAGDAHVVGVLLFAITQLHALVTHFRSPDADSSAAAEELLPFVHFLAEALTNGADAAPTTDDERTGR